MQQRPVADSEYACKGKQTRKMRFIIDDRSGRTVVGMNNLIEPNYLKCERDRPA